MIPFDFIELFAGVGGFRSALEKLGGRCVMASEINEHAKKSYRALYDGADELRGDITQIEAETVPDHHILVGGFPCQSFSVAGRRKGFEDTRGTMFFEVARIAAVKRPKLMFLENVPGLLSHDKGRTIKRICQIINEIGYAFDFNIINSKFYDVPQNRERVFIIASLNAEHEDWLIPKEATDQLYSTKREMITTYRYKTFNFEWSTNNKVTKRIRDIKEPIVDEKYYLKEEKVDALLKKLQEKKDSDQINIVGRLSKHQNDKIFDQNGIISPTLSAGGGNMGGHANGCLLEPVNDSDIMKMGNIYNDETDAQAGRVYHTDGIAPTLLNRIAKDINIIETQQFSDGSGISHALDAQYQKGTAPGDVGKGRRTHIIETVALTEARSEEAKEIRKNARKEGRDYSPRRGKVITTREDGIANCVTSTQTIEQMLLERPRYRIRRLTPLECWRLQGFTDEQFFKAKEAGTSNSQLYKQAGNAVTVNVIHAVGANLIKIIDHVPLRRSVKQVKLFG